MTSPHETFEDLLRNRFAVDTFPGDQPPCIDLSHHHALAEALKQEMGYRIYGFVVASHWPETAAKGETSADPEHYQVAQGLRTVGPGSHLASWRVRVPLDGAIASLADLFAGADWQEREQYDLVGVRFEGHPDLRRIMLPEDWEGHPLRKEYAIETPCPPWR